MKQCVLSNSYELRHLAELFPQGAMIRVLGSNDITRVGNIVILTAVGSKDEDDLVLEVAPAEAAPDTDIDDTDTDIDDTDGDTTETADTPSDEEEEGEEGKDCYW